MKSDETLQLGRLRFDPRAQELLDAEGRPVELRRQSLEVLAELARNPGQTLSKGALIESVWGDTAVTDGSLVQCIADIRRTLGGEGRHCIRTVPRRGYRLDPSTTAAQPGVLYLLRRRPYAVAAVVALVLALAIIALMRGDGITQEPVAAGVPAHPTIAVLPFENLSEDPEQRYFSDGLTEDLTTDLSRISGLRLISRASSFTYRDSSLAPRDIAEELGASHFVSGSVRRDGRRVRINATLTEVSSGANLWANRYDRDIGGIFTLQDDVTRAISAALAVELTVSEDERIRRQRSIDPDAYDLLLRGLEPFRTFTPEGTELARSYFRRAIEIDPDYARAHANLSLSYARTVIFRLEPDEQAIDWALRQAELAASLDASVPQVQFALAVAHLAARNHDAAIAAARRSIELDRSYADGYAVLAQTLAFAGELEEALPAIRTAKTLSPRYLFDYLWVEGHILFQLRRYEEARAILEEVTERNPAFLVGHLTLAATLGYLGDTEEVDWRVFEILALSPDISAADEGALAPYRRDADRRHFVKGLQLAGLPD